MPHASVPTNNVATQELGNVEIRRKLPDPDETFVVDIE
jgi:hypothetical protein